ncbi:MAG: glycosyltransferase [Rudaea sp.]
MTRKQPDRQSVARRKFAGPEATGILVLGMHRSGTSAVTRMLNLCGADLGQHLLPAKPDNARGFWENEIFLKLHEQAMSQWNIRWHDLAVFPPNWRASKTAHDFKSALTKALQQEFAKQRLWLVKDPRLSLLAPLWIDALQDRPTRLVFVIVVRHPDEVAASLAARDGFSGAHSRALWLQHMVECTRSTRDQPRVFVEYDRLMMDWRNELSRIHDTLELDFPNWNAEIEKQIAQFIAPELRHHRVAETSSIASRLPVMLDQVYRYLLRLCVDGGTADPAYFDDLVGRFNAQTEIIAPLATDFTSQILRERTQFSQELAQARDVIRAKDDEIDHARTTIDTFNEEISRARLAHHSRDDIEAGLRNHIERLSTECATATEDRSALREELRKSIQSRDKIESEMRTELTAARASIAQLAHDIEQARRSENALREENRKAMQLRDGIEATLREDLVTVRSEIDHVVDELEQAHQVSRARDITERMLLDEISALRNSRWFKLGRSLRILSAPRLLRPTEPTPAPLTETQDAELRGAIESPREGATISGSVCVAGWCFSLSGNPVAVRARTNFGTTVADTGIARADVAAAFPERLGIESCGYSTTLHLPAGEHTILVEARFPDEPWRPLETRRVIVSAVPLRAALDTPRPLRVEAGKVRFSGWCAHPHLRVMDLHLTVGPVRTACQYRMQRDDVAAALPDMPGAVQSGFEASLDAPSGLWPIVFVAVLEDGSEATLEWPQRLRVTAQSLHRRIMQHTRAYAGLLPFGLKQARRWIADNRRLPRPSEIPQLLRLARELHRQHATNPDVQAPAGFHIPEVRDRYAAWQDCNRFTAAARVDLERRLSAATDLPLLSVVMPVYNAPLELLAAAIDSLRSQVYSNWEVCIADDASTDRGVRGFLQKLAEDDVRVRLCLRSGNGNISLATNSAAELAHGEFLVLLDQDDLLTPDALGEIALCAASRPQADIIYSDDDKIDVAGHRSAPQFKPDWSPELLLGYMYFSHVFAVRKDLFAKLGGMRAGFEGSQDYDFALRASEQARAVAHIPQVLYHWRVLAGSTAASGAAKPTSFEAGRRAVQEALQRRGIRATATQPDWAIKAKCGIFGIRFPDEGQKVSILIPTRNNAAVLRRCIDSLARTTYRNHEVIVIDNDSDDPATLDYLKTLHHRVERIANPQARFNFAFINNRAAERVSGDMLLFLNDDTEIVEPRWLSQMVGYAQFSGVGAVGARLLYPDKRIQHAGVVHGYYHGLAGPAFKLAPAWDNGYLSYARVARNYSAVTAACMLTPRKVFLESGGFDEVRYEVAYNDVDYCYRLAERGLRCVYCADAELLHHEGHSRGFFDRPQEIAAFRRQYGGKRDPYYNPHLSLNDERFAIQPRRWRPDSAPPVRTLMCAFNLNWEGAPYSQLELTLGLKRDGFIDPVVYAPQDGPLRAAYEEAGIFVHVFEHPLAGVHTETAYDAALGKFGTFIESTGAEVVYGNTLQTFYAIDAAHRLGLPTLWNPRESEPWQTYFNFLPPPLAARALHCFEYPYRIVFVADATRQVWEALNTRGNFSVIHNGLNLDRLRDEAARYPRDTARRDLGIGNDEVALLLPGTVCERKGQQDLIRALALLSAETGARLRCFIVGDRASAYSVELHKLVQTLPDGLRERVRIVPETHEIMRYYQAANVFICTSRVESFPRVILEAMAFGLPVISTRIFGVVEQVHENVNALLYEPNDVNALAGHLRLIIGDDALRERLASNSPHVLDTLNSFAEMVAAYGTNFREAALTARLETGLPDSAANTAVGTK